MTVVEHSPLAEPVETPLVQLGDVTARAASVDPKKKFVNAFAYIDLSSVDQSRKKISDAKNLEPSEAPSRARQVVQTSDVLISTVRPNLNGVAVVPEVLDGAIASTGFTVLRPITSKIIPAYLFHWVKSPQFVDDMISKATGASYPAVSDKIVRESFIPLPSLPEQRRIAAILNKADHLRTQRREALTHLGALERSIFDSMFSAPSSSWTDTRLDAVANVSSGITKGRKTKSQELTSYPYLAVSNVQDRILELSVVKEIEVTTVEAARFRLQRGDLLLTEGGDPDKLGRGTVWNDELSWCLHQNHVFRVRIDDHETIIPIFLSWFLSSPESKGYFLRMAKQTTGIASINKTQLSATPLTVPPLELQQSFARRVASVERLKEQHRTQLAELDTLFASLQHRAFRGEL